MSEPLRTGALSDPEHCRLPERVLDATGVDVGRQVRLRRGRQCALYTVVGTAGAVVVSPDGRERLGVDGPVSVDPTVVTPPDGPVEGTFVEEVLDGGDRLVACAPHGGKIEKWTDDQAERLADTVGATAWICRGRWPGGGSFDRWHVTANDIHPDSFPELRAIADRGFERAVAFHGWTGDGVGVGGAAPRQLRIAVRDAIDAAVDGEIPVRLATDGRYSGSRPENLVNWLTTDGAGGVQLEQGTVAREEYGDAIADAVADVLAP